MAAPKPISWPNWINTSLFSLNNNFGTLLTLVLGCFPLDIQPYRTMSDYSIFILTLSSANTPQQGFHAPQYIENVFFQREEKFYEITVLYLLGCYLNYLLIQVSQKTSYPSQFCLSLTYHNSLDIFTTITHSGFYNPDHGKITRLRV